MFVSSVVLVILPLFTVVLLCAFVYHHFVLLFFLFVMSYWPHSLSISVPIAHLKIRSMFGSGPIIESILCSLSKKSTGPRYVVNPPDESENQTRSILGIEEEGV